MNNIQKFEKKINHFKTYEVLSDHKDFVPTHLFDDFLDFAVKIDRIREYCDFRFIVNSWYRTKDYNKIIGGAKKSAHLLARAVDVHIADDRKRAMIINSASAFGITGMGIYSNFIHLDDVHKVKTAWYGSK